MKRIGSGSLLAGLLVSAPLFAQWNALTPDPALWPYADGPTQQTVTLPHNTYALGSAVGEYEGSPAIFSVGGFALTEYSRDAPGSSPLYAYSRQSHFSIYRPGQGWISANGSDDTDNGNGTWTSNGLTGYNNGNGQLSPIIDDSLATQGTAGVGDQAFYYDGAFYVQGGYPLWGGPMARYDITANSWSWVESGDKRGLYGRGGGLIGDSWYKIRTDGALLHYDLTSESFQPDIPIPGLMTTAGSSADDASGGYAVSAIIDNLLYVLDREGNLQGIDPAAQTVDFLASPLENNRRGGTVAYDGRLYILGGQNDSGPDRATDRIQIYDPETDNWSYSVVRLPGERYGMLAEIIDDTLYLGNGVKGVGDDRVLYDDFWSISMNEVANPVPLPPTLLLLASALGLIAWRGKPRYS